MGHDKIKSIVYLFRFNGWTNWTKSIINGNYYAFVYGNMFFFKIILMGWGDLAEYFSSLFSELLEDLSCDFILICEPKKLKQRLLTFHIKYVCFISSPNIDYDWTESDDLSLANILWNQWHRNAISLCIEPKLLEQWSNNNFIG